MNVSVIIINRNDQYHLDYCLSSVVKQLQPNDQLIVIDDGSDTPLHSQHDQVNIHRLQRTTSSCRARARNIGAEMATNELLVFLDGDVIAQPSLLQIYRQHFHQHGGVALGLRSVCPWDTLDKDSLNASFLILDERPRMLNHLKMSFNDMVTKWAYFWSHNFACLKTTYTQLGGMDEKFIHWGMEDVEFGYRLQQNNVEFHLLERGVIGDANELKDDQQWYHLIENIQYMYDKHKDPVIMEYMCHGNNICSEHQYWTDNDQWLIAYEAFEKRAQRMKCLSSSEDILQV